MTIECFTVQVKLRRHKAIGQLRPMLRQTQFLSALHGDNCIHTRFPIGVLNAQRSHQSGRLCISLMLFICCFPTCVHLCVYNVCIMCVYATSMCLCIYFFSIDWKNAWAPTASRMGRKIWQDLGSRKFGLVVTHFAPTYFIFLLLKSPWCCFWLSADSPPCNCY